VEILGAKEISAILNLTKKKTGLAEEIIKNDFCTFSTLSFRWVMLCGEPVLSTL